MPKFVVEIRDPATAQLVNCSFDGLAQSACSTAFNIEPDFVAVSNNLNRLRAGHFAAAVQTNSRAEWAAYPITNNPIYDIPSFNTTIDSPQLTVNSLQGGLGLADPVDVSINMSSQLTGTINASYQHGEGALQNLGVVNLLINSSLSGANGCYLAYSVPDSLLILLDNGGVNAAGIKSINSSSTISNSQCSIGAGTSVQISSDQRTLTLNLPVTFTPNQNFSGPQIVYSAARETAARAPGTFSAGWLPKAVWPVSFASAPAGPTRTSFSFTSPSSGGSGPGFRKRLSVSYSDPNGVDRVWALVNGAVDAAFACYLVYAVPQNAVYLVSDLTPNVLLPLLPAASGGSGWVSNSQCAVDQSTLSIAAFSGNTSATLAADLIATNSPTPSGPQFASSFQGDKLIWTASLGTNGVLSGWRASSYWNIACNLNYAHRAIRPA